MKLYIVQLHSLYMNKTLKINNEMNNKTLKTDQNIKSSLSSFNALFILFPRIWIFYITDVKIFKYIAPKATQGRNIMLNFQHIFEPCEIILKSISVLWFDIYILYACYGKCRRHFKPRIALIMLMLNWKYFHFQTLNKIYFW